MSPQTPKSKFLEKFNDLVKYYEQLHEDAEYKNNKMSVKVFYSNFLKKFDVIFEGVLNPRIKELSHDLRVKAEELAKFDERMSTHDLAEKMVDRLNDLGMALYAMPDMEYIMESTPMVELNVLMTCCPEFTRDQGPESDKLCCDAVKTIKVGIDQDIQAAVRMYYERYCQGCQKLEKIKQHLGEESQ
ncbi:MAG TPA: hypothetical protein VKM55_15530 [Candidatus Lokiarchaeia archaeon]|nr:hypothetical protein [Candidatus Lokiarchaeia archaeon]